MRNILAYSLAALIVFAVAAGGCGEFSHFGQISDREAATPINHVKIDQQQPDGTWKTIDYSDGHGRFNVFKREIGGGGTIRLSRPGYGSLTMSETEFLEQTNLLMSPTGGAKDFGN